MNDNGTFKKKAGYTVVENPIARDKGLSLKAKGLYLLIRSYITMPSITLRKTSLQDMCAEGKKAFEGAWEELKNSGYLKTHMTPCNKGWKVEYELLDEGQEGAHTIYYSSSGEVSSTNLTRAGKQSPPEAENKHIPQNGIYANGSNAEGIYADGTYAQGSNAKGGNNNNPRKNKPNVINPDFINHQSINPQEGTDAIDDYKKNENIVKENIEYGRLIETHDKAAIDEIITLICDTIYGGRRTIRIEKTDLPADIVRDRLMKLDSSHIEYVLDQMKNNHTKIKNIKAYMLTALYNAPGSINAYYSARVNHDLFSDDLFNDIDFDF